MTGRRVCVAGMQRDVHEEIEREQGRHTLARSRLFSSVVPGDAEGGTTDGGGGGGGGGV